MPEVERQKFCRTQSQQNVHKEASDKCSFAKISVNNKDWCNGRGKQGKDALNVCAQGLCKDAKPTKHTQTLALQKEKMIANVINSSANKNNAAIRQTELSVVYYRSRS